MFLSSTYSGSNSGHLSQEQESSPLTSFPGHQILGKMGTIILEDCSVEKFEINHRDFFLNYNLVQVFTYKQKILNQGFENLGVRLFILEISENYTSLGKKEISKRREEEYNSGCSGHERQFKQGGWVTDLPTLCPSLIKDFPQGHY